MSSRTYYYSGKNLKTRHTLIEFAPTLRWPLLNTLRKALPRNSCQRCNTTSDMSAISPHNIGVMSGNVRGSHAQPVPPRNPQAGCPSLEEPSRTTNFIMSITLDLTRHCSDIAPVGSDAHECNLKHTFYWQRKWKHACRCLIGRKHHVDQHQALCARLNSDTNSVDAT